MKRFEVEIKYKPLSEPFIKLILLNDWTFKRS